MLDKKTILDLYNGELYPAEYINIPTPQFKSIATDVEDVYEEIRGYLPKDKRNILDDFRDALEARDSEMFEATFCEGFSVGLKLTAESLLGIGKKVFP